MVPRSRCSVAAVLESSAKFGKCGGLLSTRECLLTLVDLRHESRVGQDREGFLEALQVIVADQDCGWLAVTGEHYTVVLVLHTIH